MIRTFLLPLAASLLVAGLQAPLHAASEPGDDQQVLLYQKLRSVFASNSLDKNSILILAAPGTPLPDFDPEHNESDMDLLNQMADQVPKANQVFIPNSGWTYSSLYQKILESKQLLPNPPVGLTTDEQARLDKAEDMVKPGNPLRDQFDDLTDKFQTAMADWMNAQTMAKALNEYSATVFKDKNYTAEEKRDAAMAAGQANNLVQKTANAYTTAKNSLAGTANKINSYFNDIQQLTAKNGGAWWTSLLNKLALSKHNDFYTVNFCPPAVTWNNPAVNDWTKFTFKNGERTSSESSSSRDIEAAVGYHKDAVSVDASFKMHNENMDEAMAAKDFSCTFEVKRVQIYRKWWDPDVFQNKCWYLPKEVGNGMLSFGTLAANKKEDAILPVYVTTFFLIRNLELKSSYFKSHKDAFKKSIDAKLKVSVGPFDASGGYSQKEGGKNAQSSYGEGSISCPGVQLIGYLASVVARCPNPDPKLPGYPY